MRKILLLLLIIGAGAQFWQQYGHRFALSVDASRPYVVVYGRDSCGYTSRMREFLREQGVPFEYRVVDESPVADHLHAQMRAAGISTRRYNLPVVDVAGYISVRPEPAEVVAAYTD